MTSYCIYLYSEKLDAYESAGVYGKEDEALLVASALSDLLKQGMLTYEYNDFHEPFDRVEITKYSDTNTITTGELVYSSEE